MQSQAKTVEQYLALLPPERRALVQAVRESIAANIDKQGYVEGMSYGMIGWSVPHSVYPAGYHCDPRQPLPFACLASQKNHVSLYLMSIYCGAEEGGETAHARWFREAWAKTGRKFDGGKACIRFQRLEDVALDVIGEAIRRVPAKAYIQLYEKARAEQASRKPARAARAASSAKAVGSAKSAKFAKSRPAQSKTAARRRVTSGAK